MNSSAETTKIFINHIGYDVHGSKKFVLEASEHMEFSTFCILDEHRNQVYEGNIVKAGSVDRWKDWFFRTGDFSDFQREGRYRIAVRTNFGEIVSEEFEIRRNLLAERCLSDILFYFKSQRSSGEFDKADRNIPFVGGRDDRVDVHGGWYDASGDVSKYLSHLSYANYMNPQQIPMVVWNFLHAIPLLKGSRCPRMAGLINRIEEEAVFGADFLVRMQDPDGYFYMTVFDRWSKNPRQREICAFETQRGRKFDNYQTGYRQGGGMAIAALARVSTLGLSGDYAPEVYLAAAEQGFHHLEEHNTEYLNDGKENIIDDYCALLAAVELYKATENEEYLMAARKRKDGLVSRLTEDENYKGWWRADDYGERPYFHAAEAGLPVVALLRYWECEPDETMRESALNAVKTSLKFELYITGEVTNPYGYSRQYVKGVGEEKRGAFFFPHNNESGYWWQGENARLGSLASAALLVSKHVDGQFREELQTYAMNQLGWILGLNPYDACMLHGKGRNNPEYLDTSPNAPGGVCNGITGGFNDESDIDFIPAKYANDLSNNWRWAEQWIPHGSWLFLALSAIEDALE